MMTAMACRGLCMCAYVHSGRVTIHQVCGVPRAQLVQGEEQNQTNRCHFARRGGGEYVIERESKEQQNRERVKDLTDLGEGV